MINFLQNLTLNILDIPITNRYLLSINQNILLIEYKTKYQTFTFILR